MEEARGIVNPGEEEELLQKLLRMGVTPTEVMQLIDRNNELEDRMRRLTLDLNNDGVNEEDPEEQAEQEELNFRNQDDRNRFSDLAADAETEDGEIPPNRKSGNSFHFDMAIHNAIKELQNNMKEMKDAISNIGGKSGAAKSGHVDDFALKQVTKRRALPSFDGKGKRSEEAEAWIEQLEDYFRTCNFSEQAKAKTAVLLFEGSAKLWWKSIMKSRDIKHDEVTWPMIKRHMVQHYCPPRYHLKKMNEFLEVSQKSLSITEYHDKFWDLQKYAPALTEAERTSRFVQGLNSPIRYLVDGNNPTTVQDAML